MNTTPVAVRQYRQLTGLLPAGAGFLQSLLFEVRPLNGGTYLGTALVLVTAAVVASYFPAPTATAINPVDAIRADQ